MIPQRHSPIQSLQSRRTGPIRTPRHAIREPALQNPKPLTQTFPLSSAAKHAETPPQRSALVRSNGNNVPIPTPDRNTSDPPEKHYWQRIKAMNEAFSEAVGRSIAGLKTLRTPHVRG